MHFLRIITFITSLYCEATLVGLVSIAEHHTVADINKRNKIVQSSEDLESMDSVLMMQLVPS